MGAVGRDLAWNGCVNVRDLGGLQTASGGRTRHGAVVRADNVRRLTGPGWQTALDYGVKRVVDLRFSGECDGDPEPPTEVDVVSVSLFGQHDPVLARAHDDRIRDAEDVAAVFAEGYIRALVHNADRIATAVTAIADAEAGTVVVHCFAGKDRTGIVAALLLSVVGVPDEAVAADYAASEQNLELLFGDWIAAAEEATESRLRRRLAQAPHATMLAVLAWISESAGDAAGYLREIGVDEARIARLQSRLAPS